MRIFDLRALLAAASGLALTACPSSPAPAGPDPTLTSIQAAIFTPSCTFSSCHSSGSAAGGLVLESGKSFANLVRVAAEQTAAAQQGLLRVSPDNPSTSFLLLKLQPGLNASYGDQMPDTGQTLPDADLAAISQWITLGAQND